MKSGRACHVSSNYKERSLKSYSCPKNVNKLQILSGGRGSNIILWGSEMPFSELAEGVIIPWTGERLEWSHSWLQDCRILTQHCTRTNWPHCNPQSAQNRSFLLVGLASHMVGVHLSQAAVEACGRPGEAWELRLPPARKSPSKFPPNFFAKISHRSFFATKKFLRVLTVTTLVFSCYLL